MPATKKIKAGRDAGSGLFIPIAEAKRRKKTAVVETIKKVKRPAKKSAKRPTKSR